MGYSVEVSQDNFQTEVIEKSYEVLVVVDFFATWCGPCQILKPILEKLVKEYNFVLAKVDIDHNPNLANAYKIEGVPDVRIVHQGEVMPGFVGVLPELDLRQLLNKLGLNSAYEVGLESIEEAIACHDLEQAKTLFNQLLTEYPDRPELVLKAAKFFLDSDQPEVADQLLAEIRADQREFYPQAQALKQIALFQHEIKHPGDNEIDQNYAQACHFILTKNYEAALDLLLKIVSQDRKYKEDGARKAMLTVFELLGSEHPLTKQYRQQLMLQLY
ncbi:MAG: tetratricopeptide repeat protein [Microcoleaceae cyanobacterium]